METANQIANVLLPFCHKIAEGLSKRKPLGYVHNAVVFIFHLCLQAHNIASLQNPSFHSLLQPFFEMPKIDAKKQQIFFKTYCLCADVIGNSYLAVRDGDRTNRAYHLSALALQGIALILEILPIGTVMVFATSPTKQTIEVYSYFSLLPVGYANFTPLLTGILTILIILLGAIALFKFDNAASLRKAMFVCSVISLLLSIVPLFLFGTVGMTAASYAVSCAILLSICLQAVANRKE